MKKTVFCLLIVVAFCNSAFGLATENFGPDSEIGHPTTDQPEWPAGIVELARHPSRVYSRWCNGGEDFYFKASPEQINELITSFSKARMRDCEVVISTGTGEAKSFRGNVVEYNVSLDITGGIARAFERDKENAETLEPVLIIYIGEGNGLVKQLNLPDNMIITSDIGELKTQSRAVKPERKLFYGQVQLEVQDYYTEYQKGGFSVRLTLWEKGIDEGIKVGQVDYNGYLRIPLSDKELSMLMKGDSWLTMTTGNHMLKVAMDHPRYAPEKLSIKKETAGVELISMPKAYYGRILFEDGSPPVLDPVPWPGAEIQVSFAYAGMAMIDKQGCFKVFFSDEQFEKLKAKKPLKNIYIPKYTEKKTSTAKYSFPVSALTRDKDKPGIVKIPRPEKVN